MNGLEQIKIFNQQKYFTKKSKDIFESIINLKLKQVFFQTISNSTLIFYWISILIVFWIGGNQVIAGNLSIGVLLVLVNYMDRIEWPISRLSTIITEYNAGQVALKRFSKYSDVKCEKNDESTNLKTINEVYKIEMKDTSFQFPNGKQEVLKNINLTIKKGTQLGIIGPSGSGKTILINILFRIYVPTGGEIKINDDNMYNYSIASLREKISYISQENYLFEMSISENIAFGTKEKISKSKIIEAAKRAGAHGFIETLPDKYDSIYGRNGLSLSTGQKQRIALIYKLSYF